MTPSDISALRENNRQVIHRFFTSRLDRPEERLEVWHEDGVKELPFAPAGLPVTRWDGKAAIVENTLNNTGMFKDCRHVDLEIIGCEDPSLFFVLSSMAPEATFLDEPYPQSFVHQLRVQDGKVILQREFFNSEILAQAERTAREKGKTPLT